MARPKGHRLNPDAWEDLLNARGLSLTEIAERSGIPRPTVSSLLGGHHRASVPQAHRLAEALGCRPKTIFPSLNPLYAEVETEAA